MIQRILGSAAPLALLLAAAGAAAQTSPWYVGASQTVTHESNLYRLGDGVATPAGISKSDLVSSTALLAGLDQPVGRQRVYADLTLRASRYRENGDLDNDGHSLRAGIDWETIGRLSGTVEVSADRRLARFDTDTEIGVQTRRNVEDDTRFFAEAKLGVVTEYTAVVSLEHRERKFSAPEYDRRENRQTTGTASLRWRPQGGTMLGVGLRHTEGRYPRFDTGDDGAFVADNYTRDGVDLLGSYESGGASRYEARVTLGRTRFDINSQRDTSGATGQASWTWRPGGRLSTITRLVRDTGQDAYVSGSPLIDGVIDTSRTTTTLSLGARYEFSAKIQLRADLAYARRDLVRTLPPTALISADARGRDNTTQLSLGATWTPTRALVIGCDAGHETRSADGVLSLPYSADRLGCYAQFFLR